MRAPALPAPASHNLLQSQTAAFTTPGGGTHELCLVFRSVEGGAGTTSGNLDRVEFTDPGITVNP